MRCQVGTVAVGLRLRSWRAERIPRTESSCLFFGAIRVLPKTIVLFAGKDASWTIEQNGRDRRGVTPGCVSGPCTRWAFWVRLTGHSLRSPPGGHRGYCTCWVAFELSGLVGWSWLPDGSDRAPSSTTGGRGAKGVSRVDAPSADGVAIECRRGAELGQRAHASRIACGGQADRRISISH